MPSGFDEGAIRHNYADLGPIRLHYAEMGSGPLVVMLHGFPEHWYSYRHQLPALAAAGYHVVAPDMRGYNLSDKPRGVRSYLSTTVATDIARLIATQGAKCATVVGHDWGGEIAWIFALTRPELLDKLVVMNAPHPSRMARGLRTMPRQVLKSWYMFFFQLPWLPERMLSLNDYAYIRRVFRKHPLTPGAFSADDIERYVTALKQPGGLTGGINYYRAMMRFGLKDIPRWQRRVEAPVLMIWGEHDRHLCCELAVPNPQKVPNCRVEYIRDASHWVQNDQPERVNKLLLDFLRN